MQCRMTTNEQVKLFKSKFKEGARIKLIRAGFDETLPIPNGMTGTIRKVDNIGTVHVDWDNGVTLGLLPLCDEYKIITN